MLRRLHIAVTGNTPIPAGASAWIWSTTAQTLLLTGSAPPATAPVLTGSGQFLGNLLPERLDLATAFPASAWLTRYQPAGTDGLTTPGTWLHRFPAGHDLAPLSDAPAWLNSGEALWTTSGTPGPLNLPAAALAIRFYHQDHLGSTSVITDQSGSLVEETTNYAFGHPRNSYKPGPVLPEAYGFTQKERDKESGLNYFETRHYFNVSGRFLSVDTYLNNPSKNARKYPQSLNSLAYCWNKPVVMHDPDGEWAFVVPAAAAVLRISLQIYAAYQVADLALAPKTANAPAPGQKTERGLSDADLALNAATQVIPVSKLVSKTPIGKAIKSVSDRMGAKYQGAAYAGFREVRKTVTKEGTTLLDKSAHKAMKSMAREGAKAVTDTTKEVGNLVVDEAAGAAMNALKEEKPPAESKSSPKGDGK